MSRVYNKDYKCIKFHYRRLSQSRDPEELRNPSHNRMSVGIYITFSTRKTVKFISTFTFLFVIILYCDIFIKQTVFKYWGRRQLVYVTLNGKLAINSVHIHPISIFQDTFQCNKTIRGDVHTQSCHG